MRTRKSFISKVVIQLVFIALVFSVIFMFYYMVTNSLKSKLDFSQSQYDLPSGIRIDNYVKAWFYDGIGLALWNTLILSAGTAAITLLVGSLAAYALSVLKFKRSRTLLRLIVALMYVAPMGLVIPLFMWMGRLNLVDNLYIMILIYSGLYTPFSIFMLRTYFSAVSTNIIDACRMDGCSELRILFEMVVPLSKAGLLLLGVFNFYYVWSNLLFSLIFLRSPENTTLMVAIGQYSGRYVSEVPTKMATLVIATVPLVIMFFFVRKHFVRGATKGSFR